MKLLGLRRERGLGSIAAIVVLVGLTMLAAAILRVGNGAQSALAQDVMVARSSNLARAGTEWGLYQAFKGSWMNCSNNSQTLDMSSEGGLWVTVRCDSALYNEGQSSPGVAQTVRVFTIDAVACNSPNGCPDSQRATQPNYVERRRQVQAAL